MRARVWFAKTHADKGSPWWVQLDEHPPEPCSGWQFVGVARPKYNPEGFIDLPEGPRGLIEIEVRPSPTGMWARLTGWLARSAGWRI